MSMNYFRKFVYFVNGLILIWLIGLVPNILHGEAILHSMSLNLFPQGYYQIEKFAAWNTAGIDNRI